MACKQRMLETEKLLLCSKNSKWIDQELAGCKFKDERLSLDIS